jgi:hypothetical protein
MCVPPFHTAKTVQRESLDYLTLSGAGALCDRITKVWLKAGHQGVKAWPEVVSTGSDRLYTVRTNLVCGLPQGGR